MNKKSQKEKINTLCKINKIDKKLFNSKYKSEINTEILKKNNEKYSKSKKLLLLNSYGKNCSF